MAVGNVTQINPNAVAAVTDISGLNLVPCVRLPRFTPGSLMVSDGTQGEVTYVCAMAAAFDFSRPRLMFANWGWDNNTGLEMGSPWETSIPSITITAGVSTEGLSGRATFVPVTFGGRSSYTLAPGQVVFSDPINVAYQMNDMMAVRTCVAASAGSKWPLGLPPADQVWVDPREGIANGVDATQAQAMPAVTNSTNLYGPVGVFAPPGAGGLSGVAILGDSIAQGFQDWATYSGALQHQEGAVVRALHGTGHGVISLGYGGDYAANLATRGPFQFRWQALTNVKYVVVTLGRNDVTRGDAVATIEANLALTWRKLAALGIKVWACTITPWPTSTDNWTTVANQTPANNDANRVAINQWIRGGAPLDPTAKTPVPVGTGGALVAGAAGHPLSGIFDTSGQVETAQDSGKWQVGITDTGNTTNQSTQVTGTTDAWTKGMEVWTPNSNIQGYYVFSLVGGTLTLSNKATQTVAGATIVGTIVHPPGLHPSPQGYALMAAAINPADFT